MKSYHQKIIDTLSKKPLTPLELALSTGYAHSGISTRIAELRKLGYNIQTKPVEAYKYVLVSEPNDNSDKIIEWLNNKSKFNTVVDLNQISKDLGISLEKVKDGISKIFKKYHVLQKSNTSVIVYQ